MARSAIAALLVVSLVEFGMYFVYRDAAAGYASTQVFPHPSGYLINGGFLSQAIKRCYLLRITADDCPYCKQDQQRFSVLAARARRSQCQVVAIGPMVGQMRRRLDPGVSQLQFVDMQLGAVLDPTFTPQTLLLDAEGRLLWQQRGAMDDRALERAQRALDQLR